MQKHQDQIKPDIPEHRRAVIAKLKERVELDAFVGTFSGSTLVVHGLPFIAVAGRGGIETNVIGHGDGAGSAIFSGRARILTGTLSIVVQRTAKLGVLAAKVIAVGLHFETSRANRDTIWADGNAMVVRGLLGIAEVKVNERSNVFTLAQGIHGHGIVSGIKEERSRLQIRQESPEAEEGFTKSVRIMLGSRVKERKERQAGISISE